MPSIVGNKTRGPDSLVTPTNLDGKANSNDAPWISGRTRIHALEDFHRADGDMQTMLLLRVIARVLIEANLPGEDLDSLMAEEEASLGFDTHS